MLDPPLHVLNDNNRIVHHDADRQHQPKQREVVEAEAEGRHEGEGAHDRHWHRDQRDERRPPVLQKEQHHEGDQENRIAERLEHLCLRLLNEGRGVVDDPRLEPLGKPLSQRLQLLAHRLRGRDRIRSRQLVDVHTHARLAIEPADLIVELGPQLHPGHIPQPHDHSRHIAVFRRHLFDDHLAKLICRHQPPHGRERDLKGLPLRRRLLADVACGDLVVLGFDRRADVTRREAHRRHLHRVEPDPHAVVTLPDEVDVANTLHPQQLVADLDGGVV